MAEITNPIPDLYKYFVNVTVESLYGNIGTLADHDQTLDVITNTNEALSKNWTTGAASGNIAKGLAEVENKTISIHTFIQNYLVSGSASIPGFSQAVVAQIMHLLAKANEGKEQSADMNVVNSFNSIVTATANNEEQIGQNLTKTEGSVVQRDASDQQPLADIGNAIEGEQSNLASLVQQIYS